MKNKIFNFLRIFISVILVAVLLWMMRDNLTHILKIIKNTDKLLIFYGFVIYFVATYLVALRFKRVVSVQSVEITVKESAYLIFLGHFFNNFLPTSLGGDILKAYYAGKKSNNNKGAFIGVFMDRALALIPFTLIPAIVLVFFYRNTLGLPVIIAVYSIFVASFILIGLILHKKTAKYISCILKPFRESLWYEKIKSGYNLLNTYSEHKIVLLLSFLLSTSAQILSIIATYILAKAIGVDSVGIGIFFIYVPLVWIMTLIPSINGLGIREGAFVYFLRPYMPAENALALSLLVLAVLLLHSIIGGVVYIFKKDAFSFKQETLI
jgi:glycosyltransferase 2 family protein